MGSYREYIEKMKEEWVGKVVDALGGTYRIVDVDYNGGFLIDKPAEYTETTAIGREHITKIWG